jgi:hypothetical protein
MRAALGDELQSGVLAGMWHLITIHFTLSAVAQHDAAVWLIAAQFAGYAATYIVISLRLGGALKLFQWIPFISTAILAAAGALAAH